MSFCSMRAMTSNINKGISLSNKIQAKNYKKIYFMIMCCNSFHIEW